MGLYIYLSDSDIKRFRFDLWEVEQDVKEIFNEALQYDKSLLIQSKTECVYKRFLFWRYKTNEIKITYTIYHENIGKQEARQMMCVSGGKYVVLAYLYGLINGFLHSKNL